MQEQSPEGGKIWNLTPVPLTTRREVKQMVTTKTISRTPRAKKRRGGLPFRSIKFRLLAFLAILGPGFITANVDNDPGGILTYSQAGANFGYALLWTLIPITIALIIVQEMAARMGAVTGKGLSDLIREEFGFRATFFTMLILGVADVGNIMSEFAAWLRHGPFRSQQIHLRPRRRRPGWSIVVYGSYKHVERILLLFSLIYFTYPISAWLSHPDWHSALRQTILPTGPSTRSEYLIMVVGLIGTTITPWMQFYLQASIVEKGIGTQAIRAQPLGRHSRLLHHRYRRLLHCRGLRSHPLRPGTRNITDVADAATALKPLAGQFASSSSPSGWSMRPCSRQPSCPWPPPTTSAKAWDSSRV